MLRKLLREHSRFDYLRHYLQARTAARNAVFLWLPKTAGMSVYSALQAAGCYRLKSPSAVRYSFPQAGLVTFKHMGYAALVAEGLVSPEFDRSAFKFCFVRNPYDRAVSLYFFLRKKGHHPDAADFLAFWRAIAASNLPCVGAHKLVGPGICNPQVRWLVGTQVDYQGRFERLNEDFAEITGHLGIGRVELPWVNATRHEHWSTYYCDESKALIDALFREDFDAFGYERTLTPPTAG
jgi:hypothetical protein